MALKHIVLTVLTRGALTGYEITKNFETVYSHFWRASHQQVYRELARLEEAGDVTVKVVTQRSRPDKKVYTLTPRGLDELRQWVGAPTETPSPKNDLLVKLLAHSAASFEAFPSEFERLSGDAQAWLVTLRELQRECLRTRNSWSVHDEVLFLALRRGLLLGEAQAQWLSEVDRYLREGTLPDATQS